MKHAKVFNVNVLTFRIVSNASEIIDAFCVCHEEDIYNKFIFSGSVIGSVSFVSWFTIGFE